MSITPKEVINHFITLEISSGNPGDAVLTVLRNGVVKFDSYDKYCVEDTLTSIKTHIAFPLESRLTDNSVNYAIVKYLNDKLRRVKTTNRKHFVMKMVNVTPRITILVLLKAKFFELKNELLRGHASNIAELPPKRHENENDPNPKDQSGAAGGSGRSQSSRRSNKRQGVFFKNKETLKCNRCGC